MEKLTSFNGILLTQAVRNPKAIHLPSTVAEAFIQFTNPLSSGVCTDPAVVEDYKKDPYNNKYLSLGMVKQMGVAQVYNTFNAPSFSEPTLIMHGTKDGIVPPYFSQDWYNSISSEDVEYINWEGQKHEVFNEPAADQALDTVVDWLDRHV